MNKYDASMSLAKIREAKEVYDQANKAWLRAFNASLKHALLQAAATRMSVEEVATEVGLTKAQVRTAMKRAGLDLHSPKTLLAKTAAQALEANTVLLGEEPDLMSLLAYLPAGDGLRREMQSKAVRYGAEMPDL